MESINRPEGRKKKISKTIKNIILKNKILGTLYDYCLNILYRERRNIDEAHEIANMIMYIFENFESYTNDLKNILIKLQESRYINNNEKEHISRLLGAINLIHPSNKLLKYLTKFSERIYYLYKECEDKIEDLKKRNDFWPQYGVKLNVVIDYYFEELESKLLKDQIKKEWQVIFLSYNILNDITREIINIFNSKNETARQEIKKEISESLNINLDIYLTTENIENSIKGRINEVLGGLITYLISRTLGDILTPAEEEMFEIITNESEIQYEREDLIRHIMNVERSLKNLTDSLLRSKLENKIMIFTFNIWTFEFNEINTYLPIQRIELLKQLLSD
ncbi:MAG: hypothetical protein KatS3mg095_0837 [Candidatus Parcubacteria bacterium]|nr:MAG: hypothetical protein KatS3mg095_0837 [Candidatus Parcubacteria bacterium]